MVWSEAWILARYLARFVHWSRFLWPVCPCSMEFLQVHAFAEGRQLVFRRESPLALFCASWRMVVPILEIRHQLSFREWRFSGMRFCDPQIAHLTGSWFLDEQGAKVMPFLHSRSPLL